MISTDQFGGGNTNFQKVVRKKGGKGNSHGFSFGYNPASDTTGENGSGCGKGDLEKAMNSLAWDSSGPLTRSWGWTVFLVFTQEWYFELWSPAPCTFLFQFFFFIVDDMQMWLLRELMARTGITGYRERSIWHSGFEHTEDMKEFLSELTLTRISHSFWQTFTNLIGREWFPYCCLNLHVFDYTGSYTFFHMFVYCFAFLILWIICSCPLPIYLVWF